MRLPSNQQVDQGNEASIEGNLPEALKAGGFEEDSFVLAENVGDYYSDKEEYRNAQTYYQLAIDIKNEDETVFIKLCLAMGKLGEPM